MFDVTRESTLESALRWKADLDSKVFLGDGSYIPAVLLANKVCCHSKGPDSLLVFFVNPLRVCQAGSSDY